VGKTISLCVAERITPGGASLRRGDSEAIEKDGETKRGVGYRILFGNLRRVDDAGCWGGKSNRGKDGGDGKNREGRQKVQKAGFRHTRDSPFTTDCAEAVGHVLRVELGTRESREAKRGGPGVQGGCSSYLGGGYDVERLCDGEEIPGEFS